jgi:hypothetical protein
MLTVSPCSLPQQGKSMEVWRRQRWPTGKVCMPDDDGMELPSGLHDLPKDVLATILEYLTTAEIKVGARARWYVAHPGD